MDKRANFRQKMAELKGVTDLVVDELAPTPSEQKIEKMKQQINQQARKTETPFVNKTASRNILDVYGDLVSLVKQRMEVDEDKAREITSTIISKSIPLQEQYNLSLTEASSKILDEMEKQMGKGQVKADRGLVNYQKQSFEIYGPIQEKIRTSFGVTQTESERYTKMVEEVTRDLTIPYRGIPEERIADAIVNVAIKTDDISAISGVKNSPYLENALRMELASC